VLYRSYDVFSYVRTHGCHKKSRAVRTSSIFRMCLKASKYEIMILFRYAEMLKADRGADGRVIDSH
jgi:hypothetical protein